MAWFVCLGTVELLARTLIFLFGAKGRQEAVLSRRARVFSWFEGCLVAWFLRLKQWNCLPAP